MRIRRQISGLVRSLERHWRVRPHGSGRTDGNSPLVVRSLEDRRVLSAAVVAALVPPGSEGGIGGGGASPEGAGMALTGSSEAPNADAPPASDTSSGEQTSAAQQTVTQTDRDQQTAGSLSAEVGTSVDQGVASVNPPAANPALDEFEIGAPVLTVAPDQRVDEGTELAITNIGQFTAGGLEGGPVAELYTYTIDWGDGTPADTGPATIDMFGGEGTPTQGSFDGAHIYADNGVYTVTITLNDDLGHVVSDTLTVTVDNVAPILTVPPDQMVDEGATLSITNIGQFTDPGFDNPLNEGGETTEKFTYSIDWGDGTPIDSGAPTIDVPGGPNVPTQGSFDGSHIYADNGVYTVTVTLSDDDGGMAVETFLVTVNNVAPTLTVPPDQAVDEGATLSITNIGQFTDPGFDNPLNEGGETTEKFTYSIDWGDGTPIESGAPTIDVPGGPNVPTQGSFDGAHIYADNGVYTVTVTLSDDDGGTAVETFLVTVNNVAPTLTVPPDQTVDEGATLSITNIGQFTDPGFDNPLNEGGETTEKFTYSIDWGDGTPIDSGAPTIDVPGGPNVPTQGSFDGAHIYADNGVYTVTVTLSDDDGGMAVETFLVTVNNVAPTLTVPPDQTVDEGATLSITNIGQFTDPGFDNPLNEGGETTEKFTYSIDWGDGTPLDSGAPTIDVPGGAGVPTQGSFDGSHIYADNGVYTVTVTLSDDDGGTAVETFLVTVNNVAPTLAVPPNQTVDEGATLSITNIGQFTDPGFDNPLNVGGETTEKFTYSIDWGDGSPIESGAPTIDVVGGPGVPNQGSFDGSHIYADNGVYTVTVTISDDDGGMAVETFLVTVNNVAPILTVPPNQTVNEGSELSIPNIGQFTDPGFDNPANPGGATSETFTYSIDWGDGRPVDVGVATIDVLGSPGVPTQGSFDGAHTYADNGVYTVTVTVTDDDGGSTVETFLVTVNNVAPTLVVAPDQTVNQNDPLPIVPIGQFTDPGFDNPLNVGGETTERFTFAIDWGDGSPIDSGPAPITVPGGVGVLTAGAFNGTHTYTAPGVYTVTVTVSDDDGGSATGTLLVTVNSVAPILVAGPNQTVNEGSLLTVSDIGKFADPSPAGGQPYSFSIDWGDGLTVDHGTATVDVAGSREQPALGSFDGAHTYADNGVYTVTLTLLTADGRTATTTLQVTVNNVAPTITSVSPDMTVPQSQPIPFPNIAQYNDPGFDNLLNVSGETTERFTVSISWGDGSPITTVPGIITGPGQIGVLTAGTSNSVHVFSAAGTLTVTVTVSDDDGGSAVATFNILVAPLPHPPFVFRSDIAAGGGVAVTGPMILSTASKPVTSPQPQRIDMFRVPVASVAGAEPRLVLRVVSPAGEEDRQHEEPLRMEVLDNLRKLFERLPDGRYRIYQIEPDGIERLVVDVIVREGRAIDAADDEDSQSAAAQSQDQEDKPLPRAIDDAEASKPDAAPANAPADAPAGDLEQLFEDPQARSAVEQFSAAVAGGYLAYATPARRRSRAAHATKPDAERALSKARRWLKRAR